MKPNEYNLVVSWSGADVEGPAYYMIGVYKNEEGSDCEHFVTVDDLDESQTPSDACEEAINSLCQEYNLDADDLQITWDI